MDLPASKLGCFLDEDVEVCLICDIAGNGNGSVGRLVIDGFGDCVCFCRVDIANNNLCTLVGEESSCFGTDTLARTSYSAKS
jgi:hypothetical protein